MLSILFVATRMRAMTLTNWQGAPQGWAQDGMYMATWSILIQFLMVLLIPLCTLVMEVIRWLAFILLYVGTICVMVGAYTMTPETANGRGSVPLADKTPFTGEPVGP